MHPWSPLNDRQLALLTRIGDGADPATSDSPEFALTARALKERRLIAMPKQNGKWQAEITDAGRFYLEHGHHPDRPVAEASRSPIHDEVGAAAPRQTPTAVVGGSRSGSDRGGTAGWAVISLWSCNAPPAPRNNGARQRARLCHGVESDGADQQVRSAESDPPRGEASPLLQASFRL
jgi:hypothetical protein